MCPPTQVGTTLIGYRSIELTIASSGRLMTPDESWTPRRLAHFQTVGGTTMSSAGTSVFTETCGQVSPAKFSSTV